MKISIRFSILSILLTLLIVVSLFIVSINSFTLNKILVKTTEDTIEYASGKVGEQVASYLRPLNHRPYICANLIANNIITPEASISFIKFLYGIISDESSIISIFWADTKGNLYQLEKDINSQTVDLSKAQLINTNIINSDNNARTMEDTYDANMNLFGSKETPGAIFDPRFRPWYQQAKIRKKHAWLIYPLKYFGTNNSEIGITAIYPVYDQSSKLRGVLGMNMPLGVISEFVKNIKVTKNSIIFICDDRGHLITAYSSNVNLLEGYRMPKLDDMGIAWAKQSFSIHQQKHERVFIYEYDNKKYIAAYGKIPDIRTDDEWSIAIVTPYQDIVAPLQRSIFLSFIFIFGTLVLGILSSIIFSSRISKPIVKLAKDAELICKLKLLEIKPLYSRIKEISYMEDNFMKMKSALSSFQRYMPIALVQNLISSGKVAEVGGETKEITLLFSDIENFTKISEKMPPQEVMRYLSEYFQALTKVVISTAGTVDKYIGDGAMAFWGAPIDDSQHALHACQAALQIQSAFVELNNKWKSDGVHQTATRIGINTGSVVIGNVGSDDRLSYTALGDGVNLASRLESLNKSYKTYILVSENTYKLVKDCFKFRLIDKVVVKGREQGVYVYELIGVVSNASDDQLDEYNSIFKEAFSLYEHGDWEKALQIFSELANKNQQDHLLDIFIERCQAFCKNPPSNWTGAWVMDHK